MNAICAATLASTAKAPSVSRIVGHMMHPSLVYSATSGSNECARQQAGHPEGRGNPTRAHSKGRDHRDVVMNVVSGFSVAAARLTMRKIRTVT